MAMDIVFDQEARNRILEGVRILARAVKVTLGPGVAWREHSVSLWSS
jgi:chaperonin GroEL (HSP60 family)